MTATQRRVLERMLERVDRRVELCREAEQHEGPDQAGPRGRARRTTAFMLPLDGAAAFAERLWLETWIKPHLEALVRGDTAAELDQLPGSVTWPG
jgi:hypothetical protein